MNLVKSPLLRPSGPVAQLGERLHGMEEVAGSIPVGSTSPLLIYCFDSLARVFLVRHAALNDI
jgi:hypothetical protein